MTTILDNPFCNVNLVNAALDFYGLPHDYNRFFAKAERGNGLEATTPEVAARTKRACWVQLNLPASDFPLKKAGNADIAVVQNISLDFELPICPPACHEVGRKLAEWLVEEKWAEAGLPVEDSGAGCHIVLPIVPIVTADFGGGEAVNAAVARWVNKFVKPKFEQLKRENPLCVSAQFKVEAFDISRVLSLPGTFRPGNSKKYEAKYLWDGYVRRWLEPFDVEMPVRKESAILREMIIEEANSRQLTANSNSQIQGSGGQKATAAGKGQTVEEWLRARAAAVTMDGNHSNDFYRLMAAMWARFGDEQLIRDNARLIDELAGGRYIREGRLDRETDRALSKITLYPRDHIIWEEIHQELYIAERFGDFRNAQPKTMGQASAAAKFVADFSQYKISTLAELAKRELPPLEWLVPDLLPAGLTLLAGPPKIGKSWLTLALAMAIATGGQALGQWQASQKRVLYLGLEDNERRMQERAWAVAGVEPGEELPDNFHYVLESPKLGGGLAEFIEHFVSQYPDTKVVFVDTLVKVRPPMQPGSNVYAQDYHCLQELKALCDEYNLAIVVVHHTNKGDKSDPFARINGSNGLIGATDSNWVLEAKEGEDEEQIKVGKLTITGREIDRRSLALRFDSDKRQWLFDVDASKSLGKVARSPEQQEILDFLGENCGYAFSPKQIAEALCRSRDVIRHLLGKLLSQQLISRSNSSKYYIPNPNSDIVIEQGEEASTFNIVNAVNTTTIPIHSVHSVHSTSPDNTISQPAPWDCEDAAQEEYANTLIEEMLDEVIPYAKSLAAQEAEYDTDCGYTSYRNSIYIIEEEIMEDNTTVSTDNHHSVEGTTACGDTLSSINNNTAVVNHHSENGPTCGEEGEEEDQLRRDKLMFEMLGAVRIVAPVNAVNAVNAVNGSIETVHSEPVTAISTEDEEKLARQLETEIAAADAAGDYQALLELNSRVEYGHELTSSEMRLKLRGQVQAAIAHVLNMDLPTKIR